MVRIMAWSGSSPNPLAVSASSSYQSSICTSGERAVVARSSADPCRSTRAQPPRFTAAQRSVGRQECVRRGPRPRRPPIRGQARDTHAKGCDREGAHNEIQRRRRYRNGGVSGGMVTVRPNYVPDDRVCRDREAAEQCPGWASRGRPELAAACSQENAAVAIGELIRLAFFNMSSAS